MEGCDDIQRVLCFLDNESEVVMRPQILKMVAITVSILILLATLSIYLQLTIPASSGAYAVGQTVYKWVDISRPEGLTTNPNDFREIIALIWYPAERETGTKSPYFPGLSTVSKALVDSGEVASWEVFGLRFMRSQKRTNATLAKSDHPYPMLIFSPGNGTNMEFYNSLASEIASQGYIVVGLNHPYDVAAVELSDHKIARFFKEQESLDRSANQVFIAERIKVRTLDVIFALDQLNDLNANSPFTGMLDLKSVAVAGHSLGGITASEACKADSRFRACLNYDGLQKGGPFSTEETAIPPDQPFMFITKEAQLHPKLIEKFRSMKESYWVLIHGASHDSFTDGPLLRPSLLPVSNRADQIMVLVQKYTLAFLDQTLKGQTSSLLSRSVHLQNISVEVYPSN
jgi:Platelet-activating factor acetylhydrolase, isoform II